VIQESNNNEREKTSIALDQMFTLHGCKTRKIFQHKKTAVIKTIGNSSTLTLDEKIA
jgi:hypothetical protein